MSDWYECAAHGCRRSVSGSLFCAEHSAPQLDASHEWARPESFTVDSPADGAVCPVCGICTCHSPVASREPCTGPRTESSEPPPRPPWIDPRACWAHCDPEGWHVPCAKPSDREPS